MTVSLSPNILVYITHNNMDEARSLAKDLVSNQIAACVNVSTMGSSFHMWEDEVKEEAECVLILKTHSTMFHEVEKFVTDNHPYDNPAIIAIPIQKMPDQFAEWLNSSIGLND